MAEQQPGDTQPTIAKPKCPSCGIEGVEHILSDHSVERSRENKPWFQVVFCDTCGHVYGVFSKHVMASSQPGGPQLVLNR